MNTFHSFFVKIIKKFYPLKIQILAIIMLIYLAIIIPLEIIIIAFNLLTLEYIFFQIKIKSPFNFYSNSIQKINIVLIMIIIRMHFFISLNFIKFLI